MNLIYIIFICFILQMELRVRNCFYFCRFVIVTVIIFPYKYHKYIGSRCLFVFKFFSVERCFYL